MAAENSTVLIVNDNRDQLDVMSALLSHTGYRVLTAKDGSEGLKVALGSHPSLVISDVAMPNVDGIELCRLIRSHSDLRSTPILLVSANRSDTKSAIEGMQAGADDYVEAPYEPTRLIAKVTRLIERARSEEALRESEQRFRATFDQAAVGIAHVGPNGRWLLVNQKLCEILGYSSDELTSMRFQDITYAGDLEKDQREVDRLLRGEIQNYVLEKRYIRKGGDIVWAELTVSLLRDHTGHPKYFISVIEEITERKEADRALVESERRYRLLFENNPQPMWVFDIDTLSFLAVNEAAVHHYGFSREEFLSMTILDIRPPEDVPAMLEWIAHIPAGLHQSGTWRHRKKDGTNIEVKILAHPFPFGGRKAQLVLVDDITEQRAAEDALKRSEEQLLQSQKLEAVGQLAGGIAHDFNNILTAIGGYSELVLRNLGELDPVRRNVEEIRRATSRAAGLTSKLLAFSRRQVLQPRVLDLNCVVSDLKSMLVRLIGEDIDLVTILNPNPGNVMADAGQIEQVLMNLVVNARDAMVQGGKITIETANIYLDDAYGNHHLSVNPGWYVMLAVSDTGMGIDEALKARIFEPFFTTKPPGKGTGLGLSVIYGIVKQSGGTIWVYSEPGKGSTFKIYLPMVQDGKAAAVISSAETVSGGSETILVVEDETMVRDLVREVLEAEGYTVIVAARGQKAIDICRERRDPIDLLITDLVMPEMNGRELTERLARECRELKVLYMSGYTDDAVIRHGVLEASSAFLQKPFTPAELARRVRLALDAA